MYSSAPFSQKKQNELFWLDILFLMFCILRHDCLKSINIVSCQSLGQQFVLACFMFIFPPQNTFASLHTIIPSILFNTSLGFSAH